MSVFIGCSGYYYPAWKDIFYPADMPRSQWLGYYAEHFNTIEINSTFYSFPTITGLKKWYNATPKWFAFSIKAPKIFTHLKKMRDVSDDLEKLYSIVEEWLHEKANCILFQFPPSFTYTVEHLENILTLQTKRILHICEFRHISWRNDEVLQKLQDAWIVFCNISHPTFPDIYIPTDNTVYLRLHWKETLFKSWYGATWLQYWIDSIENDTSKDIFIYFNNTRFGEALKDATYMQKILL